MKFKVLLIGATGLLGSNIAELLNLQRFEVKATIRKTSDIRSLKGIPVQLAVADLSDIETLRAAIRGCENVIHAAAEKAQGEISFEKIIAFDCKGTANLIEVAREEGIKKFIHISSANTFLRNEDNDRPKGFNSYVESKSGAEDKVMKAFKEYGFPAVIISPAFMIGSRDSKPSSGEIMMRFLNNKFVLCPSGGKSFVPVKMLPPAP